MRWFSKKYAFLVRPPNVEHMVATLVMQVLFRRDIFAISAYCLSMVELWLLRQLFSIFIASDPGKIPKAEIQELHEN